jgi:WD40 repeat protein
VTGRWNIETVFPRGVVRSVAFSQDDRWLACASEDGNVRIFNTEDARLLHLLQVSEHGVTSVAWQPNGNRLATISSRGDVKVWDEQGRVVASRSPDVPTIVADLTWNPDGTRLAFSVGNGKLAVLSADLKGEPLLTIKHRHDFDQLAWSSDGQWIATSFQNDASDVGSNAEDDRNVICLWNASDGSAGPKLVGHNGSITDLAWKGDSASLASSSLDGTVRIWTIDGSAPKGEVTPTETLEHDGAPVLAVAWSSDDALLATGTNGRGQDQVMVRTWDSSRWREEHRLSKFPQAVSSLTWSHKGRRLATGTGVAGKAFNTFWGGAGYSVNMFQFSGAMPAKMWPWVVLHGILDITWNCDSTRLASVRGTGTSDPFLCRWNARLGRFDGVIQVSASRPNAASYSPSPASKGIAIGGGRSDHSVRLWDTDRRQPGVVFEGHPGGIRALSWHPKGTEIASAGAMSEVRRWSTASGELLGQPFDMKCAAVVYSPGGGRLAVAGSDGIQVLDLATQKTTPLPNTATASVNALAWSPTGLQIASCSDRPNSSVTVWPLNTVNRPLVFQYDFCDLFDVAWEPNGNRLAAAADDGSVVIFHTKSPGESKTLPGHVAALNAVAWSPDGTMLASSGRDAMIHVWNAQTLEPLWVGIMLPGTDSNGSLVTFSAAGEVLSGFEKPFNHLVYLHEHADGQLELLSQADFMDRVDKSAATAAEQSGDEP